MIWAHNSSPAERGYGTSHQRLRRQLAPGVATGTVTCTRHGDPQHPNCPGLIAPDAAWELGHDDLDRTKYSGPEHRECNQLAGRLRAVEVKPTAKRPPQAHPGLL